MNEAELLFTQVLNCNRQDLYLKRDLLLDKKNCEFISRVLKKRISGEPIQYILGTTEFMGLEFKVLPGAFIPRPETEILVETAIEVAKSLDKPAASFKILDIGTGSGCIAVSLAKIFADAQVTATDVSSVALDVARENANLNNAKVNFIKSDLFAACGLRATAYELIVCNPPYIPTSEIEGLAPEVRFEPGIALDGGSDGLDFYRRIIKDSPAYLKNNGYLILEMGFTQRRALEKIADTSQSFSAVRIVRDYNDIERVIVLKKTGVEHG
jgi:release factor glutamine methyltransferase